MIRAIGTQKQHTVFVDWMKNVVGQITGVVAIDGKQAQRTKNTRKAPLHMVSAFSWCWDSWRVRRRANEITAIPKLLGMLELKGCIVTIEAMGHRQKSQGKSQKKVQIIFWL